MQKTNSGIYVPTAQLPQGYARFDLAGGGQATLAVAFIVAVCSDEADRVAIYTTTSEEPFHVEGELEDVLARIREVQ